VKQLVVIDYGAGNIASVGNALETLRVPYCVARSPADIDHAPGIVLPGVGAFAAAMEQLRHLGLVEPLTDAVLVRSTPFLGICLGMQLLARDSTEQGLHAGLGWLDGHVRAISPAPGLRVPHVGWNVTNSAQDHDMFANIGAGAHFYYDHSFALECAPELVVAQCDYGSKITAAIRRDHIWATQFHPEKSQRNGLVLLRNFSNFVNRNARN
jgi:glutamine amidotransferase